MRKPVWERAVTADGCSPLLFYLVLGLAVALLSFFLRYWVTFGGHLIAW